MNTPLYLISSERVDDRGTFRVEGWRAKHRALIMRHRPSSPPVLFMVKAER